MLTILQQLLLGAIQGITEWIPISSSAALILVMSNLFAITDLHDLITTTLFFHLGTFFAALIYFKTEAGHLFKTIIKYKYSGEEDKKTLNFIVLSTIISGILGLIIVRTLFSFESSLELTGKSISFFVGFLLLFTGIIQIRIKNKGLRKERNLKLSDSVLLGVAQGIAVLPGISRSGITISALLLKKFDDTSALKLSFLMSLPIVLLGNIFLNFQDFTFTTTAIYGLIASFILGILTIHLLMRASEKINFGWFVIIFALLMMLSIFV
ncbi:MAG: undecaprenyl-diphosphate phosphatase [archaeon]